MEIQGPGGKKFSRSAAMQIPGVRHDDLMALTSSGGKEVVLSSFALIEHNMFGAEEPAPDRPDL